MHTLRESERDLGELLWGPPAFCPGWRNSPGLLRPSNSVPLGRPGKATGHLNVFVLPAHAGHRILPQVCRAWTHLIFHPGCPPPAAPPISLLSHPPAAAARVWAYENLKPGFDARWPRQETSEVSVSLLKAKFNPAAHPGRGMEFLVSLSGGQGWWWLMPPLPLATSPGGQEVGGVLARPLSLRPCGQVLSLSKEEGRLNGLRCCDSPRSWDERTRPPCRWHLAVLFRSELHFTCQRTGGCAPVPL